MPGTSLPPRSHHRPPPASSAVVPAWDDLPIRDSMPSLPNRRLAPTGGERRPPKAEGVCSNSGRARRTWRHPVAAPRPNHCGQLQTPNIDDARHQFHHFHEEGQQIYRPPARPFEHRHRPAGQRRLAPAQQDPVRGWSVISNFARTTGCSARSTADELILSLAQSCICSFDPAHHSPDGSSRSEYCSPKRSGPRCRTLHLDHTCSRAAALTTA